MGVGRAVELGLSPDHPILTRVRPYLEGILAGRIAFPDRPEKHDNWPTGIAMFTAATLSRFAAHAPALEPTWDFWADVVRRSFAGGAHDLNAELQVHRQRLGRSGAPAWMRLNSMPVLMILGSRPGRLPEDVQRAYVHWLWNHCPAGLIYADVPLNSSPRTLRGHQIDSYLTSLELLAAFPCCANHRPTRRPALARIAQRTRPMGFRHPTLLPTLLGDLPQETLPHP
ncbi:MAG: hypothetical protein CMJ49_09300 [Planctomycetaceae bacterium]|nr:hypothetical protein [Planctomycetaceae bacterium]